MSVYIVRKPELLHKVVKDTLEAIWVNTTIADLVAVGNQKRICFTVNGQPATLDVYQSKDGSTTFRAVGKNIDLTNQLITELEKRAYPTTSEVKSFSMYVGTDWIQKCVKYLIQLTTAEDNGNYDKKENYGNVIHSFTSGIGDKLTLTECPGGKLLVQGKPLYLYNEFLSFVSYSPNVNMDEIIAATKVFVTNKVTDVASARAKMASMMPKAYNSGVVDDTIWKVFSPSMALIDADATMEDYSCLMFPALRALEGYLQFLLNEIGEVIDSHHLIGNIFQADQNDPNKFVMIKHAAIANANRTGMQYKPALENIYTYFNNEQYVRAENCFS